MYPFKCPLPTLACLLLSATAQAQTPTTTTFTYQGRLLSAGQPVSGVYDLRFRLYDVASGGAPLGLTQCRDNVTVTGGVFTVTLDYGEAFAAPVKFLEIELRPDTGLTCIDATGLQLLSPRQPLTAAPLSTYSLSAQFAGQAATANSATTANLANNATSAGNAINLNGQPASFYTSATNLSSGTLPDARLSPSVAQLNLIQTFSAQKTFSTAPAFTSAAAPFFVSNPTLVPNLNADLLDGLSASAFALANHTHDAAAIATGTLSDLRLSSNVPRLNAANAFTAANSFTGVTTFANNVGITLNLGVGTIAPTGKLHINDPSNLPASLSDTAAAPFKITNGSGGALLMDANQIESVNGPLFLNFRSLPSPQDVIIAGGGGRVGIGGTPTATLEVFTSPGFSLQFRNDGPVPGLNVDTTGGNAGIMRLRNGLEVWPNDAGTVAGKIDVRNAAGNATITLDGSTGNATYTNQAAVAFAQTFRDPRVAPFFTVAPGTFANLESITANVPGPGFVMLTATANVTIYDLGSSVPLAQQCWLKIEDFTGPTTTMLVEVGARAQAPGGPDGVGVDSVLTASWVVPVSAAGVKRFRTVLTNSNPAQVSVYTTSLNAVYIPRGM
jgi:hypothetical protein